MSTKELKLTGEGLTDLQVIEETNELVHLRIRSRAHSSDLVLTTLGRQAQHLLLLYLQERISR